MTSDGIKVLIDRLTEVLGEPHQRRPTYIKWADEDRAIYARLGQIGPKRDVTLKLYVDHVHHCLTVRPGGEGALLRALARVLPG